MHKNDYVMLITDDPRKEKEILIYRFFLSLVIFFLGIFSLIVIAILQ